MVKNYAIKKYLLVSFLLISILCVLCVRKISCQQISFSEKFSDDVCTLLPINTYSLPNISNFAEGFTCTGLAYDCSEDVVWGVLWAHETV